MIAPIPRFIPLLLLSQRGLVKGTGFREHRYVGDPINTMRIFSEMEADEVMLLDIEARAQSRTPSLDLIARIADECYLPLAVGGGISNLESVDGLIRSGVEKVVLNTGALHQPDLVTKVAKKYGSQSVVVCIDYSTTHGRRSVVSENATTVHELDPLEWAKSAVSLGAGEVMLSCVDRDGAQLGFDEDFLREARSQLHVPIIASGGAGRVEDLESAASLGVSAAAGSLFVFYGRRQSVLVSYPLSGRDSTLRR